ncbi:MAG: hypothetical protein HY319_07170 [Armatimonadetes bacterium]|nr:hypothetical protein [Armatimonadota bacterium]
MLETILAGFLLISAVLLISNLYPTAILAVRQAEHRIQANALAQTILDEQRAAGFAGLALGTATDLPARTIDSVVYRPRLEVFEVDADPEIVKGLRVNIEWDFRGKTRGVAYEIWIHDIPR